MDKYAKLREVMTSAFAGKPALPLVAGTLVSIEDDTCTVDFGTIKISGIRLKVQVGGDADKLILFPAVGKMVLCGSLTGDLRDMVVLKAERLSKLQYDENGLSIEIDSATGKVKLKNGSVSLKDLFDDLKSIIQNLKVFTPSGPSGNPLPPTMTSLTALQNKINQLLN